MTAVESTSRLQTFIEQQNYAGYDPYDALRSPLAPLLTLGSKAGRMAWTQLLRRLPFNIRPLLLIQREQNPKALGLFLEGYVGLYKATGEESYKNRALALLREIRNCRSKGCRGHGWGYNFEWQSRTFRLPAYTPTIVNSAFIGHALLDAAEVLNSEEALELALPIQEFILNDLNRVSDGTDKSTFCFSYTPRDEYAVHNANLLGASLLIRLWSKTGNSEAKDAAMAALAYSMKHQRPDGSWFYSEREGSRWIDSFHTGFNLEAIRHFLRVGEAREYEPAYKKGVRYYADNFFLPDGTPKYYHDRTYPTDIHSPAEAICFFSAEPGYKELTSRVLKWMLENMADPRGYFYFRKGRYFTNKIPYMRWGQAWAFRALSAWLSVEPKTATEPLICANTR